MAVLICKAPSGDPTNLHFATATLRSNSPEPRVKSTWPENYTYTGIKKVGYSFTDKLGRV